MKAVIILDGERRAVEVDLERGVVRWNDRELPVRVVRETPLEVELEVAGERLVVEGWVTGMDAPPRSVVVAGERYDVGLERQASSAHAPPARRPPSIPVPPPAAALTPSGPGTTLVPPMPGRVVEVRVKNGDAVKKGQVLLVLEAMKMRNEVLSPTDGTVAELRVGAGANVRAGEAMLSILPGS